MMMIKVYKREYDWYTTYLKPVKLTGRWKIEVVDGNSYLYLECKGVLFASWVHEGGIVVQDEIEYINECSA
jgi:hypothetical protein